MDSWCLGLHTGHEALETPGSSSTKCGAGSPVGQRDCDLEDAQGGGFGTGTNGPFVDPGGGYKGWRGVRVIPSSLYFYNKSTF